MSVSAASELEAKADVASAVGLAADDLLAYSGEVFC